MDEVTSNNAAPTADMHPALTEDLVKAKADLLQEMKVTKGCRFNASKRLEKRDRRMISIIAFASVYVILLTVLPLFFHVGEGINSAVTATTIIFSLVILASSLLQYSNNDPVRSEQHHRCGLEVNALRRELRALEYCDPQILSDFGRRYDEILQKYSLNHDDIDFDKYKIEHPFEYPRTTTDAEKKEAALKEAALRVKRSYEWSQAIVIVMSLVAGIITIVASESVSRFTQLVIMIFNRFGLR